MDPVDEPPSRNVDARFWSEMYWFVAIGLGALIVGILVLPPRMVRCLELLEQERRARQQLAEAWHREAVLEGAIEAMENDPFYQHAAYRKFLRLKRNSEEYLEPTPPSFPITPVGRSSAR